MEKEEIIIRICHGKTCREKFAKYIQSRLEADKKFYNYTENIKIVETTCMGKCEFWPNIKMNDEIFLSQNPIKASENVKNFLENCEQSKKSEK